MRKPQIAIETAGYGTTTVQFIVTRNGEVVGADYKRRCNERVDKEVLRLVNMLSGWTPATKVVSRVMPWYRFLCRYFLHLMLQLNL